MGQIGDKVEELEIGYKALVKRVAYLEKALAAILEIEPTATTLHGAFDVEVMKREAKEMDLFECKYDCPDNSKCKLSQQVACWEALQKEKAKGVRGGGN